MIMAKKNEDDEAFQSNPGKRRPHRKRFKSPPQMPTADEWKEWRNETVRPNDGKPLSCQDVGDAINYTRGRINQFENEDDKPDYDQAYGMAQLYALHGSTSAKAWLEKCGPRPNVVVNLNPARRRKYIENPTLITRPTAKLLLAASNFIYALDLAEVKLPDMIAQKREAMRDCIQQCLKGMTDAEKKSLGGLL